MSVRRLRSRTTSSIHNRSPWYHKPWYSDFLRFTMASLSTSVNVDPLGRISNLSVCDQQLAMFFKSALQYEGSSPLPFAMPHRGEQQQRPSSAGDR